MHRTKRVPCSMFCIVLLGLVACASVGAGTAAAQDRKAMIIPINGTQKLQMSSRKAIVKADNPVENVARVSSVPNDPTTVLITGLEPGITRITLTDADGRQETYEVIVQLDVEYLRSVLQRAVPTANIQPIPGANNAIILTGTVNRSEDIDIILRAAQSVVLGPDRVINAMRVAGPVQVGRCVTVAQVSRSEFRRMAFTWLDIGGRHFLASTLGIPNTFAGNGSVILNGSVFNATASSLSALASTPSNIT